MTRTIIIPLSTPNQDTEGMADRALTCARMLVGTDDVRVLLVSAIDENDSPTARQGYLDGIATTVGHDVETLIARGDPAGVILNAANNKLSPIIVMASHGRRGVQRRLVGSVTSSVARRSTCPVLTFPATFTTRVTGCNAIKHVLLPMNDPSSAGILFDATVAVLGARHAREMEFHLAEVTTPIPPHPVVAGDQHRVAREVPAHFLRRVAERIKALGYRATWDLRIGDPARELMRTAVDDGISLIAMPAHTRNGFNSLVPEILAEQVRLPQPVPVLLVHPEISTAKSQRSQGQSDVIPLGGAIPREQVPQPRLR